MPRNEKPLKRSSGETRLRIGATAGSGLTAGSTRRSPSPRIGREHYFFVGGGGGGGKYTNASIAPPLTSFLASRSRTCALLLVFGFFSVFGRWFIWVFVLIVAVLVLLVHRCTVPNLARGYAGNCATCPFRVAVMLA